MFQFNLKKNILLFGKQNFKQFKLTKVNGKKNDTKVKKCQKQYTIGTASLIR